MCTHTHTHRHTRASVYSVYQQYNTVFSNISWQVIDRSKLCVSIARTEIVYQLNYDFVRALTAAQNITHKYDPLLSSLPPLSYKLSRNETNGTSSNKRETEKTVYSRNCSRNALGVHTSSKWLSLFTPPLKCLRRLNGPFDISLKNLAYNNAILSTRSTSECSSKRNRSRARVLHST